MFELPHNNHINNTNVSLKEDKMSYKVIKASNQTGLGYQGYGCEITDNWFVGDTKQSCIDAIKNAVIAAFDEISTTHDIPFYIGGYDIFNSELDFLEIDPMDTKEAAETLSNPNKMVDCCDADHPGEKHEMQILDFVKNEVATNEEWFALGDSNNSIVVRTAADDFYNSVFEDTYAIFEC